MSMATPSTRSASGPRGRSNWRMNGSRARPCGVCGVDDGSSSVGEAARDLAAPLVEPGVGGGAIGLGLDPRLVHRVVDGAAEVPDRDDRLAARRGQDEERVVEVGVAGHVPGMPSNSTARASGWRARAAPGTSPAPSVGRDSSGLRPGAAARSRIRMPPSQVRRSSRRSRPVTRSATGRPWSKRMRVRRTASSKAFAPGLGPDARGEIAFLGPPPAADFGGQVDPAAAVVDAEVLPEVGQLQRRAQAVGRLLDVAAAMAGDAEDEAADRVRRAAAVVEDPGPLGVAPRLDVLPERAQQIVEQLDVELAQAPGLGDGGEDAVGRIAARRRKAAARAAAPSSRRAGDSARPAPACPRRRSRRPPARTRRRRRRAAASRPGAAARRPGSSRSARARCARSARRRPRTRAGSPEDGRTRRWRAHEAAALRRRRSISFPPRWNS